MTSSTGLIDQLNELEFINGIIYANVWYSNQIALIDPLDGRVIGWVDLSNLPELTMEQYAKQVDVLNGIAYDANSGSLLLQENYVSYLPNPNYTVRKGAMCVQTGKEIQIVESIVNKYCDYPGPAIPILQEIQARLGYVVGFHKKWLN